MIFFSSESRFFRPVEAIIPNTAQTIIYMNADTYNPLNISIKYPITNGVRKLTFIANLKQKLPKENHVLFCYNNKIVYFCALKDNEQEEKNRSIIENSLTWWNERSTIIARAGISSGFYYFGQAEENHMRAEKALLYLKTQNKIGLLHYKDIGISQLFFKSSTRRNSFFFA